MTHSLQKNRFWIGECHGYRDRGLATEPRLSGIGLRTAKLADSLALGAKTSGLGFRLGETRQARERRSEELEAHDVPWYRSHRCDRGLVHHRPLFHALTSMVGAWNRGRLRALGRQQGIGPITMRPSAGCRSFTGGTPAFVATALKDVFTFGFNPVRERRAPLGHLRRTVVLVRGKTR